MNKLSQALDFRDIMVSRCNSLMVLVFCVGGFESNKNVENLWPYSLNLYTYYVLIV